ncbi:hypothetical protein UFOVP157_34 [uncultured Caudovirales phage]|uniref:Uncharacterized protein n=1 Tax=uncultured Caudovirales phage TaxID=2100421 RepID=A0A6J7WAF9_9CAUD|nr:hypothetical protein UFOVP157_34 [uncultured Caudovirales phage]
MLTYRFKNLEIRHQGKDYLTNGIAFYTIEDYDEDGKEALFEKVELYDALGSQGYINDQESLTLFSDIVQANLNQDSALCRSLGHKVY